MRDGQGAFTIKDLENALPYCTHLLYGYAAINEKNKKIIPLNEDFDVTKQNYKHITELKSKFTNVKFILSVGGNADVSGEGDEKNIKYRDLLESSALRLAFVNSAYDIVKTYDFDGIDLAWEFPESKPKENLGKISKLFNSIKKKVLGPSIIDKKAEEHKQQFTALVRELKRTFASDNLQVSLSVLPNVNSSMFYDPKFLAPHLDFVNLLAFDYYTPSRTPEIADFTSPIYELVDRRKDENIDAQVKYWISNGAPGSKLLVGVPTYGRAWKMTKDSNVNAIPPLTVDGAAEPGPYTRDSGLLSYPEVCQMGNLQNNYARTDDDFKIELDPTHKRGSYIYKQDSDKKGSWISYEDPGFVATKVQYVKTKGLGGISVFDITLDDFKGTCARDKYPILRSAHNN